MNSPYYSPIGWLFVSFAFAIQFVFCSSISADITLTDRESFLNASDINEFNFDLFDEFGFYDGSITHSNGVIMAEQTSNITDSIFEIDTFVAGGPGTDSLREAFSLLTVEFEVNRATNFSFEAQLVNENPNLDQDAGLVVLLEDSNLPGNSGLIFRFSENGNSTFEFSESGTLAPGSYFFMFDNRSFGFDANVSASATLAFEAVPEPSALIFVAGFGLAVVTKRRRLPIC